MLSRSIRRGFKLAGKTNNELSTSVLVPPKNYVRQQEVYIPSQTIEFSPKGDTLLYECNPYEHKPVFFPFPHVLSTLSVPLLGYAWWLDAFGIHSWTLAIPMYLALMP